MPKIEELETWVKARYKTQAAAAAALEVAPNTLSQWINGVSRIQKEPGDRLRALGYSGPLLAEQGAALPGITVEHIQEAYRLLDDALGAHDLLPETKGLVLGLLAEGLAEGKSPQVVEHRVRQIIQRAADAAKSHPAPQTRSAPNP